MAAAPTSPTSPPGENSAAVASTQSAAPAPEKSPYVLPANTPTQSGPMGLRFDFNNGLRLYLPETAHPWRVQFSDLDTGNVLYQTELKSGAVSSGKRYFVRFRLEVGLKEQKVFSHDYSAADREVLIQFPVGTLGDTLGWFPYAVKFKE